jgi:ketosteroid isomerase-like protein
MGRNYRVSALGIVALLATGGSLAQSAPAYDKAKAEATIREGERQWAASVATGDTEAVERILAEDFVGVDPDGHLYEKAEMVRDTASGPKYFASNQLNDVRVRFYGDTAVAQGNESWVKKSGVKGRFVWTDTWVLRNGTWQIVAAEDLIAPEPGAKP